MPELQTLSWDSVYLCPSQKSGFDFFVCGMKPEHLFAYQLFAFSCNLNLTTITTGHLAHLHLYKTVRGNRFRQSQLSLDLLAKRYDMGLLVTQQTVEDLLYIDPELNVDLKSEYKFLGTTLGLFLSERNG